MNRVDLKNECQIGWTDQQINTQLDQETVVLNLATGKYYSLEGVGSYIWQALQSNIAPAEVIHKVSNSYDVGEKECQEDVLSFLEELADAGLIKFT